MTTTTTTLHPAEAEAAKTVRGDVPAALTFYSSPPDGSKPYYYIGPPPAGVPASNLGSNTQTVTLHDLRGAESGLSLDKQGFVALPNVPSPKTDFFDEDQIRDIYYPSVTAILHAALPGIQEVFIFDHTIRRTDATASRGPVLRVHVDQTAESGFDRVRVHLPEARVNEIIEKGIRTRIVNVWRPLNKPVRAFPLGFADSTTVREEDMVSVAHIYPHRTGATGGVSYHPDQKWYYWSGQTPEEVMLIKCYDSDTKVGGGGEGRRGRSPHSAFIHPGTPEEVTERESIEVRCLIIG